MNDLISRAALLAAYDAAHKGPSGGARRLIEEAPTVDAEHIVRCCDCRHFKCNLIPDGYLPYSVKETECLLLHFGADYTDFCSYGERKEE